MAQSVARFASGRGDLYRPQVNLVQAQSEQQSQLGKEVNWVDQFKALFPFRFNTVRVHDGTVTFRAPAIQTKDAHYGLKLMSG